MALLRAHSSATLAQFCRKFGSTSSLETSTKVNLFDLNFDRRIKVDYKESIKYMESEAYKKIYQGAHIWYYHRRNYKGEIRNDKTRPNCLNEDGFIGTSYPCVICRDEYLVIHPENTKLIQQFVNAHTGKLIKPRVHGLCQRQWKNLVIATMQAKDLGTMPFKVPDRHYDYTEYYDNLEVHEG